MAEIEQSLITKGFHQKKFLHKTIKIYYILLKLKTERSYTVWKRLNYF